MRWALEIIAWTALAVLLALPVISYGDLPDKIPTHFGGTGAPDGWGSKNQIWMLPAIGVGMFAMLSFCAGFAAKKVTSQVSQENRVARAELERSLITALKAQVMMLFAYLAWTAIETAHGRADGLNPAFLPVVISVTAVTLAFYFIRRSQLP
jgi:uncharacterized membrane protein